jgi:hypothetical protein
MNHPGQSEYPFGVSPECFAAEQLAFVSNPGITERSDQMRIRTIAAALVVAAPLLVLESPSASACWEGRGYGYGAAGYAAPRYGYMSYGYSSPAYYGGYGGYYGGYGGYGIARGIARRNIRRAAYGGVGYRGGVGVRRGLGVGVGRVGRFR